MFNQFELFMMQAEQKPTHRDRQKEETRKLILASAYTLFQQNGYDGTTMRQLAGHCGVGLGTLFKHFPDKSAILVATFEGDISVVIEQAFETLPRKNIHQQLRHLLLHLYGYYARHQAFSRVLVKESLFLGGPAGDIVHGKTMAFLDRVATLFVAAADRREIAPFDDAMSVTLAFWSFYLLGLVAGLRDSDFDVNSMVELVATLLRDRFPQP
ncbi:hypothetical protein GCM10007205_04210 [Oxalicibacterium flavum]|uniref:HTH tetR-type domain-containing protein n=2 Tax=Oxalicibacterium flavum TaxID=179467 RepID=A0A8J2XX82_9BURK|nr:hypothetical protein GCM10007205_04210 [Oxalicibacterium flavum]